MNLIKSSNKKFSNRGTDGRTNGHFEDLAQLKLRTGPDQIRQSRQRFISLGSRIRQGDNITRKCSRH